MARVHPFIPSLYNIVTHKVWRMVNGSVSITRGLHLPPAEKSAILNHSHHVIAYVSSILSILSFSCVRWRLMSFPSVRSFVTSVLDERTFCTIKSIGKKTFTMCLEHMGGVVPLLVRHSVSLSIQLVSFQVGRKVSRVLPHFQISLHSNALSGHNSTQGIFAEVG